MWAYIVAATKRDRRNSLPSRDVSSDTYARDFNPHDNQNSNNYRLRFANSQNDQRPHPTLRNLYSSPGGYRMTYNHTTPINQARNRTPLSFNQSESTYSGSISRYEEPNSPSVTSQRLNNVSPNTSHSCNSTPRKQRPIKLKHIKKRGASAPNLNERYFRDLGYTGFQSTKISNSNQTSNDEELIGDANADNIEVESTAMNTSSQDNNTIENVIEDSIQKEPLRPDDRKKDRPHRGIEYYIDEVYEMGDSGLNKRRSFVEWIRMVMGMKRKKGRATDDFLEKMSGNSNKPNVSDEEHGNTHLMDLLVVDPSTSFHYRWLAMVSVAILYNLIFVIGRAVFWELNNSLPSLWWAMDYVCDTIYFLDSLIHAHEGYLEQGIMVRDVAKLRINYIQSSAFKWDIVSLLPTDIAYIWWSPWPCLAAVPCSVIVRVNRMFKMSRLWEWFDRTETATGYPNAFRICKVVLAILVLIHWNACLYFAISYTIGFSSDNWVYNSNGPRNSSLARQYIYSFYWSTLTLTTIGETPQPENDAEYLFVVADFLAGVLIFATIVGNIGSMISNMNLARVDFQNRMDGVKQYMAFRRVGSELEARVIRWFSYTWAQSGALDEERVLSALPDKLKAEIAIRVHLDTLRQVRIFQDCEPGLLEALVLKLRLQIFSPGDYICRKGDVGKEMYIVKRGKLTVVGDDGKTVFVTLSAGSVFGEVSVLDIAGNRTGNRRTANVRSSGYSDLFCLSKRDLWEALADYPEARTTLTERGCQILRKDGLLDEEAFRGAEQGRESLEVRVERLQNLVNTMSTRIARLTAEVNVSNSKLKQRLSRVELRSPGDEEEEDEHRNEQRLRHTNSL